MLKMPFPQLQANLQTFLTEIQYILAEPEKNSHFAQMCQSIRAAILSIPENLSWYDLYDAVFPGSTADTQLFQIAGEYKTALARLGFYLRLRHRSDEKNDRKATNNTTNTKGEDKTLLIEFLETIRTNEAIQKIVTGKIQCQITLSSRLRQVLENGGTIAALAINPVSFPAFKPLLNVSISYPAKMRLATRLQSMLQTSAAAIPVYGIDINRPRCARVIASGFPVLQAEKNYRELKPFPQDAPLHSSLKNFAYAAACVDVFPPKDSTQSTSEFTRSHRFLAKVFQTFQTIDSFPDLFVHGEFKLSKPTLDELNKKKDKLDEVQFETRAIDIPAWITTGAPTSYHSAEFNDYQNLIHYYLAVKMDHCDEHARLLTAKYNDLTNPEKTKSILIPQK